MLVGVRLVFGWCSVGVRLVFGWCPVGVRLCPFVFGWVRDAGCGRPCPAGSVGQTRFGAFALPWTRAPPSGIADQNGPRNSQAGARETVGPKPAQRPQEHGRDASLRSRDGQRLDRRCQMDREVGGMGPRGSEGRERYDDGHEEQEEYRPWPQFWGAHGPDRAQRGPRGAGAYGDGFASEGEEEEDGHWDGGRDRDRYGPPPQDRRRGLQRYGHRESDGDSRRSGYAGQGGWHGDGYRSCGDSDDEWEGGRGRDVRRVTYAYRDRDRDADRDVRRDGDRGRHERADRDMHRDGDRDRYERADRDTHRDRDRDRHEHAEKGMHRDRDRDRYEHTDRDTHRDRDRDRHEHAEKGKHRDRDRGRDVRTVVYSGRDRDSDRHRDTRNVVYSGRDGDRDREGGFNRGQQRLDAYGDRNDDDSDWDTQRSGGVPPLLPLLQLHLVLPLPRRLYGPCPALCPSLCCSPHPPPLQQPSSLPVLQPLPFPLSALAPFLSPRPPSRTDSAFPAPCTEIVPRHGGL